MAVIPDPQKDGELWLWQDGHWQIFNEQMDEDVTKEAFTAVNDLLGALDVLGSIDPSNNKLIAGQEQAYEDAMEQAWTAHTAIKQMLEDFEEELSEKASQAEEAEDNLDDPEEVEE